MNAKHVIIVIVIIACREDDHCEIVGIFVIPLEICVRKFELAAFSVPVLLCQ
jgi:hypothetical protein